jgi:hypothetical protein
MGCNNPSRVRRLIVSVQHDHRRARAFREINCSDPTIAVKPTQDQKKATVLEVLGCQFHRFKTA